MQPNQQDQNQQAVPPSAPAPMPYQVPAYLHLDPVTGQTTHPHKKWLRVIIIVVVSLVVLVAAVSAFYIWQRDVSEKRFYSGLENLMTTKYFTRSVTYKHTGETLSINSKSDFSDSNNPKSSLTYSDSTETAPSGPSKTSTKTTIQIDQVSVDDKAFAERFVSGGENSTDNLTLNQWYKISSGQNRFKSDGIILNNVINTPLSSLIIGNFSQNHVQDILKLIKSKNVYQITATTEKKTNRISFTIYSITINVKSLAKVYDSLTSLFPKDKISGSLSTITAYSNFDVWVNNDNQLVTKTVATQKAGSGSTDSTVEVDYGYPDNVSIAMPQDIIDMKQEAQ